MINNGKQLTQMFRLGWSIILGNPSISAIDFAVKLEATSNFDRDDWALGSTVFVDLGYLPVSYSWTLQRAWMSGLASDKALNIKNMLEGYFRFSSSLQIASLNNQLSVIQNRYDMLENGIVKDIEPWIASPARADTPEAIMKAVDLGLIAGRAECNQLHNMIVSLQNQLDQFQVLPGIGSKDDGGDIPQG